MEPSIDPELGKKLLEDYIINKTIESAPWQKPEFARRQLEDYLKYKSPYISTFSLRMSFDSLNDKKDIKLAEKFMFHDDWNLILGSTDAMKRLGVSLEKIFDIYKAKLKDPKKRNISILALERLGYVPGNAEERLAFYIKHNKFDSIHKEMPQKIDILYKLLNKEKDIYILEKGIEIIGRYYTL